MKTAIRSFPVAALGNFASFHITYPHAKAKQYDPWIERIAKEFKPFLKRDYDRVAE